MARPVGSGVKWETPEQLQQDIDKYFNSTPKEEWTMTGLAIAVNADYQTIINYSKKESFYDVINRAKLMVHNQYEISLRKNGRSGDIFALKNFGWKDKQEVEQTTRKIEIKDDLPDEVE